MYIQKFEKYGQRELARQLLLGDYMYGIITHNETVNLDSPCDVLYLGTNKNNNKYFYCFDDHGLVNTYFQDRPILEHHNEYDLVTEFSATKVITQTYMEFMAKSFGDDYVIREYDYRTDRRNRLKDVYNQNVEVYRQIYLYYKKLSSKLAEYKEQCMAPGELIKKHQNIELACKLTKEYLQYVKSEIAYQRELSEHVKKFASQKAIPQIEEIEKEARKKYFAPARPEVNIDNAHNFITRKKPSQSNNPSEQVSDHTSALNKLCDMMGIDLDKIIEDTARALGLEPGSIPIDKIGFKSAKIDFDEKGNPVYTEIPTDEAIKNLEKTLEDNANNPNFRIISADEINRLFNGLNGSANNQNEDEDDSESQK